MGKCYILSMLINSHFVLFRAFVLIALIACLSLSVQARDFEGGYAAYGAGSQPCSSYVAALKKGSGDVDYFVDWLIGYFSAFNVIMPNTYNILGESSFPSAQGWLDRHCRRYPKELFVNATARLTEVLYPTRYQSGLKDSYKKQASPAKPKLGDIKKFVK